MKIVKELPFLAKSNMRVVDNYVFMQIVVYNKTVWDVIQYLMEVYKKEDPMET
jgi:hypothetical protein